MTATVADPATSKKARKAAEAELAELHEAGTARIEGKDAGKTADQIDAEITARLEAKRAERAAKPGSKERTDQMQKDVAAARAARLNEADQAPMVLASEAQPEPVTEAAPQDAPEAPPVAFRGTQRGTQALGG